MVSKGIYYANVINTPTETYKIPTSNCYFVITYNDAFSNIMRRTPAYFYTAAAHITNFQVSNSEHGVVTIGPLGLLAGE